MTNQIHAHLGEDELVLLLENRLDKNERQIIEAHLTGCEVCRTERRLVEKLNNQLENLEIEPETCPSPLTLMMFHYGELDAETERHLKRHLINCRKCAEEVVALEQEDASGDELLGDEPSPVHATPTPLVLALIAIWWRSRQHRVMRAAGEEMTEVKLRTEEGEQIVPFKVSKPPTINEDGRFSVILKAGNEADLEGVQLQVTLKGLALGEGQIRRGLAPIRGDLIEKDLLALKDSLSKRGATFPLELPMNELRVTCSS